MEVQFKSVTSYCRRRMGAAIAMSFPLSIIDGTSFAVRSSRVLGFVSLFLLGSYGIRKQNCDKYWSTA